MSNNRLARILEKNPKDFTKADLLKFARGEDIRQVNFMYPAGDGRLKTLNFIIQSEAYLDEILSCGERVDGSSLFSAIDPDGSDLYVVPKFRTAFLDPFASAPTLTFLCSFFNRLGEPLANAPENTLLRACQTFHDATGLEFEAMGELEYYVIAPNNSLYPTADQRGYHESAPYAKFNDFRQQCMMSIAQTGGQIKYGHTEVGSFTLEDKIFEQNEIEFLPVPADEAASQLLLAKWALRNQAFRNGFDLTFAPKITLGKAGSGMHVHMRMMKDKVNQMLTDGKLSETARRAIAGLMQLAPALTAFGNTNPTSYFRLVPNQEAPTSVCWGDCNRSVLVRVPLGWTSRKDLCSQVNPQETACRYHVGQKQTIEIRSPDASADVHLLLAGLAVACRHGLEMADALDVAEKTYVSVNIHQAKHQQLVESLTQLPDSCAASAECLLEQRAIFEKHGVFSPEMIDDTISQLRAHNDVSLRKDIKDDTKALLKLVNNHFHCG